MASAASVSSARSRRPAVHIKPFSFSKRPSSLGSTDVFGSDPEDPITSGPFSIFVHAFSKFGAAVTLTFSWHVHCRVCLPNSVSSSERQTAGNISRAGSVKAIPFDAPTFFATRRKFSRRNGKQAHPMNYLIPATHVSAFTSFAGAISKATRKAALSLLSVAVLLMAGAATVRGNPRSTVSTERQRHRLSRRSTTRR